MNKKHIILSVDLQKDFAVNGGKHYHPHPNVDFIQKTLIPFLRDHKIKVAEIVSDYRQPRPGDRDDSCNPGKVGYESIIPDDIKLKPVWIKCMNSPIWTRENAGEANKTAGLPYEDTIGFGKWLEKVIGDPDSVIPVIVGLTIDCCCLCTTQELSMRGYEVKVLAEGVDPYSGNQAEKEQILAGSILSNWGEVIYWDELRQELMKDI